MYGQIMHEPVPPLHGLTSLHLLAVAVAVTVLMGLLVHLLE